jgi:hypothetical protein
VLAHFGYGDGGGKDREANYSTRLWPPGLESVRVLAFGAALHLEAPVYNLASSSNVAFLTLRHRILMGMGTRELDRERKQSKNMVVEDIVVHLGSPAALPRAVRPDQILLAVSRASAGLSKFQISTHSIHWTIWEQTAESAEQAPGYYHTTLDPVQRSGPKRFVPGFAGDQILGIERPVAILTVISGARLFNVRLNPFGRCMQERGTAEHKCSALWLHVKHQIDEIFLESQTCL